VGAEVDVHVVDVEFRGRVDLLLHAVDGLLAQVRFGCTEVHEVRGVDDPRAVEVRRSARPERLGLLVAEVRVLPHLRGVREDLTTVPADV